MRWTVSLAILSMALAGSAAAVSFSVPTKAGTGAYTYSAVDPAPVGISFEFFAFPSYFTNVTATNQCLNNWKDLTGVWPPIRIGGTTQDRALYNASSSAYVVYTVASPTDAPDSLTFGPSFMTLAGTCQICCKGADSNEVLTSWHPLGTVVVGLNRGKNEMSNTISAAKTAVSQIPNLLAIELGNEPEYYSRSPAQPIATGGWSPALDAASQNDWDTQVGSALNKKGIIQAGVFNDAPPTWGVAQLIATENATVKEYVKTYAHHNYPGGTITSLMNHANIATNLHVFDSDVATARAEGKPYVFGETNSVSGGGAAGVSPTFGAALWTLDYTLRATYTNISRSYFHHGTVGSCQYCFWGRYSMGAPYYGAYVATAFLAKASYMTALDSGSTTYAAYASFDSNQNPLRALIYNSDYFDGSGTRTSETFTLTGLTATTVRAKRLTAASALSRQDQGSLPTFGGQTFTDGTCTVAGTETFETQTVSGGQVSFTLSASEALLVYLQ